MQLSPRTPVRDIRSEDWAGPRPIIAVWELTLKCDQPCEHCGSRAGARRERELSTEEVLRVAKGLVALGCREVGLIGGEAYLRDDLELIVRALAADGLRVTMQTGGRAFTKERAEALAAAGLSSLGVSVDGPASVHDRLRGNLGSHAAALRAMDNARAAGLVVSANSQINRLNWHLLRETAAELRKRGAQSWQVQLTGPMGRAADRPEWIIEPHRVVDIIDILASIQTEAMKEYQRGAPLFRVVANNNVGYFGPHEELLRSTPSGDSTHYRGCNAGIFVLGIESDGTVKACPTLPTGPYAGGNVLTTSIEELWKRSELVAFARDRSLDELWGHCRTCYYADVCRAGCSWTVHTTLGRRGNNPFCYHRVVELRKKGIREKLVPKEQAPGTPYDFGRFDLVEEPWPEDEK